MIRMLQHIKSFLLYTCNLYTVGFNIQVFTFTFKRIKARARENPTLEMLKWKNSMLKLDANNNKKMDAVVYKLEPLHKSFPNCIL